jgi:integrase/recombinase XerD
MRAQPRYGLSLFSRSGNRKYLNAAERRRFAEAAMHAPERARLFCLVLRWSGTRVSEVLALTPAAIDIDTGVICIRTLKRRARVVVRQVPLPPGLLNELDRTFELRWAQRDLTRANRPIFRFSRTTAWRYVKGVMATAGVTGMAAMPKGLRHAFGVNAFQMNIPPHLLQRWLGHASLRTTGIYGDVVGPDERAFAARMWRSSSSAITPIRARSSREKAGLS